MTTMYAIRYREKGAPSVLRYETVDRPVAGEGHVLVRMLAIGINYADVARRRGDHYPVPTPLPFTPGGEGVGMVEALGAGVDAAWLGQRCIVFPGAGCYADYAVVPVARLYPVAPALQSSQATALFVQGLSAALLLTRSARLKGGETVLIHGAAGGVGMFAVQLARLYGAGRVIGLAGSAAKCHFVRQLGATAAVNYTGEGWTDEVRDLTGGRGVDIVLETSGGATALASLSLLATFGRLVTFGNASGTPWSINPERLPSRALSVSGFWLRHYLDDRELLQGLLDEFARLIGAGALRVHVERVLPLSQAADAHVLLESRQSTGKIVLVPDALIGGDGGSER